MSVSEQRDVWVNAKHRRVSRVPSSFHCMISDQRKHDKWTKRLNVQHLWCSSCDKWCYVSKARSMPWSNNPYLHYCWRVKSNNRIKAVWLIRLSTENHEHEVTHVNCLMCQIECEPFVEKWEGHQCEVPTCTKTANKLELLEFQAKRYIRQDNTKYLRPMSRPPMIALELPTKNYIVRNLISKWMLRAWNLSHTE